MLNNKLFVYGTLLDTNNEFATHLKKSNEFYCQGKMPGKLYDIGDYPGAIYMPDDEKYVYGSIFLLKNSQHILKVLDEYEEASDTEDKVNLFKRELITVYTETDRLECWAYLYNLPVENLKQIISGRYIK